jgi:Flp pilus assembly protein TadG
MSTPRPGLLHRLRRDDGSLTVFTAALGVVFLLVIGLVVDGGGQIRNLQKADTAAQEAGRAAGQAVNPAALARGNGGQVDPAAAATAARSYLTAAGVQGTVTVTSPTTLQITTTTTYSTVFLGVIGIGSLPASGGSQVRLVRQLGGQP